MSDAADPPASRVGRDLYFEDFTVGWAIETAGVSLTEGLIHAFGMTYDPQPFHTDLEAAKAGPYGTLIASGWQTVALCFRQFVLTGAIDRCSMGGVGLEELRWLLPVRPGDTIRVRVEVTSQRPSTTRPDRGYVQKRFDGYNQKGERVITFLGTSVFRRRP